MNALLERFGHSSLAIIGFPCNQFGMQEPGSGAKEILNGIKHVRPGKGFVPDFNLTIKIDVNGADEHPLWSFLKRSCPSTKINFARQSSLYYTPFHERDVKWNWEKFLIEPETGLVYKRYDASVDPYYIADDIEYLLSRRSSSSQSPSASSLTSSAETID
uniref:Glutathione peroxidase n=2 Tax=Tetranychus urticae TaxID=32264 RepID=T1L002_TETUR